MTYFLKQKMDTNFSGKFGVVFAPKTTFLVIFPTFSMLNLKKTSDLRSLGHNTNLMCHLPGFEAKIF